MKLNNIMLAMVALSVSGGALAHGFIKMPPSRDTLCSSQYSPVGVKNTECGGVAYEPQSSGENWDGFDPNQPGTESGNGLGPRNEHLLSITGETRLEELNRQTASLWYKNKISPGINDFTWQFTAVHPISSFKYYITKQDWNPNAPLTRAAFESKPFCEYDGGDKLPESNIFTMQCNVPKRTGYQVIYAGWDVADTDKTFYKAIDVMFDDDQEQPGTPADEWSLDVGDINPTQDLKAGSTVTARVFDQQGENSQLAVTLNIADDEAGKKNSWTYALAEKINAERGDQLHAGQKNAADKVEPVHGFNDIFTRSDSTITRVEISVEGPGQEVSDSLTVSGLNPSYAIADGKAILDLNLQVQGKMIVEGDVYDAINKPVAHLPSLTLENETKAVNLPLMNVTAGKYTLVMLTTDSNDRAGQQSFNFELTADNASGDYKYVWPEGLGKYKAGDRVLQPKNNKVYQCKPGAVAGWCNIWTAGATQYEPGTGSNWQDAWIEK